MNNSPNPEKHLYYFLHMAQNKSPFTFVRFSDGEIEILRNRRLSINNGKTEFRGMKLTNTFPEYDKKIFDPQTGQSIRKDLFSSACFCNSSFYKGIPTSHNLAVIDREFMLRLNGGFSNQITFSDVLINSNFLTFRKVIFPNILKEFKSVYVVCNLRSKFSAPLADAIKISIPDNFFADYNKIEQKVMNKIHQCPQGALILSSASSLSNILGWKLRLARPDLTFIDVGTVLNDLLGLDIVTREYHVLSLKTDIYNFVKKVRYKMRHEYKVRW